MKNNLKSTGVHELTHLDEYGRIRKIVNVKFDFSKSNKIYVTSLDCLEAFFSIRSGHGTLFRYG